MRNFVEHLAGAVDEGAFGVEGDQGGMDESFGDAAGVDDVGMELGAGVVEGEGGGGFEGEGEGESVGAVAGA